MSSRPFSTASGIVEPLAFCRTSPTTAPVLSLIRSSRPTPGLAAHPPQYRAAPLGSQALKTLPSMTMSAALLDDVEAFLFEPLLHVFLAVVGGVAGSRPLPLYSNSLTDHGLVGLEAALREVDPVRVLALDELVVVGQELLRLVFLLGVVGGEERVRGAQGREGEDEESSGRSSEQSARKSSHVLILLRSRIVAGRVPGAKAQSNRRRSATASPAAEVVSDPAHVGGRPAVAHAGRHGGLDGRGLGAMAEVIEQQRRP